MVSIWLATAGIVGREDARTRSLGESKSRNKVSVGEPAEGSLPVKAVGFTASSLQTQISARFVSRLVRLSFGVGMALEASHGDGLKLERARRDASFKEVGDTPARPALSLQNGGRSRSRTEGYLSFEAPALKRQLRLL